MTFTPHDGPKQRRQERRANGKNPLAYMGVLPESPINFVQYDKDPTTGDFKDWVVGDMWENYVTNNVWQLVRKVSGVSGTKGIATWVKVVNGIGNLSSLKDSSGTVVQGDAAGTVTINSGELIDVTAGANSLDINFSRGLLNGQIPIAAMGGATQYANITAGANVTVTNAPNGITISSAAGAGGEIQITGDSGTTATSVGNVVKVVGTAGHITSTGDMADKVTLDIGADVALKADSVQQIDTDAGSVVPAAGVLTITGNSDIVTSQSGPSTVRISRFQSSFLAFINTEVNASGDYTDHQIGSIAAMTESYDLNGDFDPGDGAGTPATFSAPVKGIYLFTMSVSSSIPVGAILEHRCFMQKNLVNFFSCWQLPTRNRVTDFFGTNGYIVAGSATTVVDMEVGDVITYRYIAGGGTKTATVESGSVSGVLLFQLP